MDRVGMARPAGGIVADAKAGAGRPETDGGRDGGTMDGPGVLVAPGAGAGGAGPGLGMMAEEAGTDGAGVAVWLVPVPADASAGGCDSTRRSGGCWSCGSPPHVVAWPAPGRSLVVA